MEETKTIEAPEPILALANANPKLVDVNIGNFGRNVAEATLKNYDPEENPHLSVVLIEPNVPMLESCFTLSKGEEPGYLDEWKKKEFAHRFKKIQLGSSGLGAGGDPAVGRALAEEPNMLLKILEAIADNDHVKIAAGGGGGSAGAAAVVARLAIDASGYVVELAAAAPQETKAAYEEIVVKIAADRKYFGKKTAYCILTQSRVCEGSDKGEKSKMVADEMLKICPTLLVRNENISDKTLTHKKVFQEINEKSVFRSLWLLKSMLLDRGDVVDIDGNDWGKGCNEGNHTYVGFFDASRGFDKLEEELLGNPYLDSENIRNATRVLLWYKGEWIVLNTDKVEGCIRKKMRNEGRDKAVAFKAGIQQDDVPENTLTVGFVTFARTLPGDEETDAPGSARPAAAEAARREEKEGDKVLTVKELATIQTESQSEIHAESGTNGIPAPAPAKRVVSGKKANGSLVVNNQQVHASMSVELISRLDKFIAKALNGRTLEAARREFEELSEWAFEETGEVIDTPRWLTKFHEPVTNGK
jgi:cell division GTPase FtsZ